MVGEGICKITLWEESGWGWGIMKWMKKNTERGWGIKGVTERGERERGKN